MTKLKILAAVAASTLALGATTVATTASAQPWNHDYHNDYRDNRLTTNYVDRLSWKIDNAQSRGVISWRQARDLHMQLREVQPLAWRYERGQARPWEVRRLENVVDRIDSITQGYAYNMRRPYWR